MSISHATDRRRSDAVHATRRAVRRPVALIFAMLLGMAAAVAGVAPAQAATDDQIDGLRAQ